MITWEAVMNIFEGTGEHGECESR